MAASAPQAAASRVCAMVVRVTLEPAPATTAQRPLAAATQARTSHSRSARSRAAASPVQPTGTRPATPASIWRATRRSQAALSSSPSRKGVTRAV
jgi:hypothetical protein